jgi:hypothetical protein
LLLDRRSTYAKLVSIGVPVPKHVVFDHLDHATAGQLQVDAGHLKLNEST